MSGVESYRDGIFDDYQGYQEEVWEPRTTKEFVLPVPFGQQYQEPDPELSESDLEEIARNRRKKQQESFTPEGEIEMMELYPMGRHDDAFCVMDEMKAQAAEDCDQLGLDEAIQAFLDNGFIDLDDYGEVVRPKQSLKDSRDSDYDYYDLADYIGYRKYRRYKRIVSTLRAKERQRRKTTHCFGPDSKMGKWWQFDKACYYWRMGNKPNPKQILDNEDRPLSDWIGQLTALDQIEVFGEEVYPAYPSESEAEFFSHYSDEEEEEDHDAYDDNRMMGSSLSETLIRRRARVQERGRYVCDTTDEDVLATGTKFGG